jgi:hypothetical protein
MQGSRSADRRQAVTGPDRVKTLHGSGPRIVGSLHRRQKILTAILNIKRDKDELMKARRLPGFRLAPASPELSLPNRAV